MTIITIWGGLNLQVTLFYMIYLFWFMELLRTLIDFTYLFKHKKSSLERNLLKKSLSGSLFLMFVYFVFIIVIFGFIISLNDVEDFATNVSIFYFRNWFFNLNLILFAAQYLYFRLRSKDIQFPFHAFNNRHIVLHISIIFGAMIYFIVLPRIDVSQALKGILVALPFILLKAFFDFRGNKKQVFTESNV